MSVCDLAPRHQENAACAIEEYTKERSKRHKKHQRKQKERNSNVNEGLVTATETNKASTMRARGTMKHEAEINTNTCKSIIIKNEMDSSADTLPPRNPSEQKRSGGWGSHAHNAPSNATSHGKSWRRCRRLAIRSTITREVRGKNTISRTFQERRMKQKSSGEKRPGRGRMNV